MNKSFENILERLEEERELSYADQRSIMGEVIRLVADMLEV